MKYGGHEGQTPHEGQFLINGHRKTFKFVFRARFRIDCVSVFINERKPSR